MIERAEVFEDGWAWWQSEEPNVVSYEEWRVFQYCIPCITADDGWEEYMDGRARIRTWRQPDIRLPLNWEFAHAG